MKPIVGLSILIALTFISGCSTTKSESDFRPACNGATTHGWDAWNNVMPGSMKSIHVTGYALVNNGGYEVALARKFPQGTNSAVLLLDLQVTPPRGVNLMPILDLPVSYSEVNTNFSRVQVFCGERLIADLPVKEVY